jgi:hypothetical protein
MKDFEKEKQARFTENFYYSCLYNSLVLFAATPHYLQILDGPGFDVPFEMESEFDYAFREPAFDSIFKSGKVAEELRSELLQFKNEVDELPNALWQWEEIMKNAEWQAVRTHAERLLVNLGETRREYDFSFTKLFES